MMLSKLQRNFRIVGQFLRGTASSRSQRHANQIATVESEKLDALVKESKLKDSIISTEKKMDSDII